MSPQPTFKLKDGIARLETIEAQIESDKERGAGVRAGARLLHNMSSKLEELMDTLQELGASGNIQGTVDQLEEWAEVLNPNFRDSTWDKEEVNELLIKCRAAVVVGMATDSEVETIERLSVTLKSGGGTGERGPRTPQPIIEGRPTLVKAFAPDVDVTRGDLAFSTQSGNRANSAANVKTAAVAYVKKVAGLPKEADIPTEDSKGLLAAAKEVVENGSPSATYGGITFVAWEDTEAA